MVQRAERTSWNKIPAFQPKETFLSMTPKPFLPSMASTIRVRGKGRKERTLTKPMGIP